MTGSLTLAHAIGDLSTITAFVGPLPEGPFVTYELTGSDPALRISFALDPPDMSTATGFTILADGETYATGDFEVSLDALAVAIAASDIAAARAVLFENLTSIALGPDADLDLATVRDGVALIGNALGTSFLASHGASTIEAGAGSDSIEATAASDRIDAGNGDDFVTIHGVADGKLLDGGGGYDTLQLVSDAQTNNIAIKLFADEIEYDVAGVGIVIGQLAGFEFFRGSVAPDRFWGRGDGHRFEGGDGADNFASSLEGGILDIVDYSSEGGNRGIIVNFGDPLDADALPAVLAPDFRAAVLSFLDESQILQSGATYDTFGNLELIEVAFRVVGSANADVFHGGLRDDVFEGDEGADLFFGGEGNDTIDGGAGEDTLYLTDLFDPDKISWDDGVFEIIGADGTDTVSGVEYFQFADELIEASSYGGPTLLVVADANDDDVVTEAGTGVAGDAEAVGNVLANDTGDDLSVSQVSIGASGTWNDVTGVEEVQGLYGKLTIADDGSWTYTLNQTLAQSLKGDEIVHDIFAYRATDGSASGEANLDISIKGSNDAPISAADAYSTNEDVTLVTPTATLLANDSDPEAELLTVLSVQAAVNGIVTISGSDVSFAPTAGFHGAASYSYTIQDASGGTATHSVAVTVGDVNDAPSGANKSLSVLEDAWHQFSSTDFGFTDPDGDDLAAVTIATLPLKGTLKLNGTSVAAGQEIAVAQVGNLIWTPPPGENGSGYASFTFKVRDDGGTANGGSDTDLTAHTISFDVTPVNDAPNGAGSTVTVLEDGVHSFQATDFGFADVDGNALKEAIVVSLPASGLLTLGTDAVTLNQVIAAGQLANLKWAPPANESGVAFASFTFRVVDTGGVFNGGADTDPTIGTVTFNVTPVNDAPNGAGSTVTLLEDGVHSFQVVDFGFTDSDGNALKEIIVVSLPGNGLLTLGSDAVTLNQVITAAQAPNLKWIPPANQSGAGLASFTVLLRDVGGTADGGIDTDATPGTITFNVTPVNNAPNGAGSTVTLLEDGVHSFQVADFGFADTDGNALNDIFIVSLPADGLLTLDVDLVTPNQVIAAAQIPDLKWTPSANETGAGLTSFTFRVRDTGGTADGGVDTDTTPGSITFDVSPVNDAPNGAGSTVTVLEDGVHSFQATDFGFSDADGNALKEIIVVSLPTSGLLTLGTDAVTLNQVIATAQIPNLKWAPPVNQSGVALASFTFKVRDTGGIADGGVDTDASPGTISFDVALVNDAPNGAGSTVTLLEDGVHSFQVVDFGFTDSDGNALKEIIVVSLPGNGLLTLGSDAVTLNQVITAAQIPGLKWTTPTNQSGNGVASFTFKVRDTGGTADGGVDTDATPGTISFNVTPVNDAPNGAGSTVPLLEDGVHEFQATDFGFTDPDGNALKEIVVVSLPSSGILTLGSDAVVLNQVIAAAQISDLKWTPPANQNGTGLASFMVQVRDTGGTADGGVDTDASPGSISFNVTPVNGAPDGVGSTVMLLEDGAHSFQVTEFGFSDADGNALKEVVIVSLPANGLLTLGADAVTVNQVIAAERIGDLKWTPPADRSGSSIASFTFKVVDAGGTDNGGVDIDPTAGTIVFDVTQVNDAPIGAGSAAIVLEDGSHTFELADFGFADGDGDGLKEIVLVSLPSKGVLTFGSEVVSVNQVITAAQIGSLKWTPPANEHGAGLAGFTFIVRDTGGTADGGVDTASAPGTITFTVTPINDAPNGAGSTISVTETTTHVFEVSQFGFSDFDGHELQEFVVRSLPGVGVLKLGSDAVVVGQVIAKADLSSLNWVAPTAASGVGGASFTFAVRDTGGTANGGADTDPTAGTIAFTVTPINSAPSASDSTITLLEDQPYVFGASQLGYDDPNGDSLKEIVVTSLPGKGLLRFGGVPVVVNQVVAAGELGDLIWTPPAEASGTNLASIGFMVRDTGGTAGGGVDLASAVGTMSFNVTIVNDAPRITTSVGSGGSGSIVINEGTVSVTSIVATDPDSKKVTLSLVGEDRVAFVIAKGQLQFKPAPDFEAPRDANKDGIYKVGIRAIDNSPGAVATVQELTISVANRMGNVVLGNDTANTLDKTKKIAGGLVTTIEEDHIDGKGGNDIINALDGNDTLIGGLGNDKLTGGAGADHFVFNATLGSSNVDTVADFVRGTDEIGLAADVFAAIGSTLEAGELRIGKGVVTAADADDFIIYDTAKGKLYYDADGAELELAPILFATLTRKPPLLDAGDFMVV